MCRVAKMMDRLIQNQDMKYLEEYELISVDQSACLKRHTTQTCLQRVIDDRSWSIEDGLVTSICALDICRCLDMINH